MAGPIAAANWLLWDPAHWMMQLKQFRGLRRRAESAPNGTAATPATEGTLHAWVYRRSGGRVLGRMGGQPALLLRTSGRRSGLSRTTPGAVPGRWNVSGSAHAISV